MNFPLSMPEISLWLATTAIILIITSEVLTSLPEYSGRLRIEKKRFRLAALGCSLAFLATVLMRVL